jgi:hypothetical protein
MRHFEKVLLALVIVAGALATPGAAQTPPATLTGESLTGQPQVTSNCNTAGNSTISYSVTGISGPPYVGTFMETGVVTIGPQPVPGFAVPATSFSASFVIDSPPNRVTGTKRLAPPGFLATGLGVCTEFFKSFGIEAFYDARIETPDGVFLDHGRTGVALNEPGLAGQPADFNEFFVSDLFQTIPAPPAAKVTGGGSIEGTSANTGFVVQRKEQGGEVTGEWQFINRESGDIVHSVVVDDLVVTGNTATFSGECVNRTAPEGTPCSFRVTVQDNGEGSGAPPDTVNVDGVGFTGASGTLDGNAQVGQE